MTRDCVVGDVTSYNFSRPQNMLSKAK